MARGPSKSGYRCVATIEVPAGDADRYDELVCGAKVVFTQHGWKLLESAQRAVTFDTSGAPAGITRTVLHAWGIPSLNSLVNVMASAADNEQYVEAQQLTLRETQNLYMPLLWADPIGLPSTPVSLYMLEELNVVNSIEARTEFTSYMSTAIYQMNENYGWKILLAGNACTGAINHYVHFWGMSSDTATLEQEIQGYRADPRWVAAVNHVTTSIWTPRPMPGFQDSAS
jgi:hypothetical protein